MSRTSFALLSATKIGALGAHTGTGEPLALEKTVSASSGRSSRSSKRFSFLHSRTHSDTSQASSGSAISVEPSTPPFSPVDDGYLRTAWDADVWTDPQGAGRLSPRMAAKEERSRRYSSGMVQAHAYTSGHTYLRVDWNNPGAQVHPAPEGPPPSGAVSAEEFNRALRHRSPSGGSLSLTPPIPPPALPVQAQMQMQMQMPMPTPMPMPMPTPSPAPSLSPCGVAHGHGYSQLNTTLTRPDACLRRASHNDAVQPRRRVTQYGYDELVPVDMSSVSLQQALGRDGARRY